LELELDLSVAFDVLVDFELLDSFASFAAFASFALFSDVDFDVLELDSDILESFESVDDELELELELDFSVVFELLDDFESAPPVLEDDEDDDSLVLLSFVDLPDSSLPPLLPSSSHSSSLPFPFPFPLPCPLPLLFFFLPSLHLPSPLPSFSLLPLPSPVLDSDVSDVDELLELLELLESSDEPVELDELDESFELDELELDDSLVDELELLLLSDDSWVTVVVTVSICVTSILSVPLISLQDSSYVAPFTANPQYFIANPLGPITTIFTTSLGHPTLAINGER